MPKAPGLPGLSFRPCRIEPQKSDMSFKTHRALNTVSAPSKSFILTNACREWLAQVPHTKHVAAALLRPLDQVLKGQCDGRFDLLHRQKRRDIVHPHL